MPEWTDDMPGGSGGGCLQWLILIGLAVLGVVLYIVLDKLGLWEWISAHSQH